MSSATETGLQQRTGYTDQSGGYVNEQGFGGPHQGQSGGYVNEKGFGGPHQGQSGGYVNEQGFGGPHQGQGNYQGQGTYPVQQSYAPHSYGTYQGQTVGPDEYVDRKGRVVRRRVRGGKFAACLAACWCITWPCHGPCCGGL